MCRVVVSSSFHLSYLAHRFDSPVYENGRHEIIITLSADCLNNLLSLLIDNFSYCFSSFETKLVDNENNQYSLNIYQQFYSNTIRSIELSIKIRFKKHNCLFRINK